MKGTREPLVELDRFRIANKKLSLMEMIAMGPALVTSIKAHSHPPPLFIDFIHESMPMQNGGMEHNLSKARFPCDPQNNFFGFLPFLLCPLPLSSGIIFSPRKSLLFSNQSDPE